MAEYSKTRGISKTGGISTASGGIGTASSGIGTASGGIGTAENIDLTALVPRARQEKPRTYLMVEYQRRDTGAVIQALDLLAPDAPDERVMPVTNLNNVPLEFATVCVTHDGTQAHFATAARVHREVRSSPKWCDGCRDDVARNKLR
jgi:hypothetical protein